MAGGSGAGGSGADTPTALTKRAWWGVLRRTLKEFSRDNLTDWAAALTYYGVLSLFPGIIVLTSLLSLLGPSTTRELTEYVDQVAPGPVGDLVGNSIEELQKSQHLTGPVAVVGLVVALWTASGYLAAFVRACNAIYDVPEGRPIWKTIPLRVLLTLGTVVLVALVVSGLVLTGGIADRVGKALGLGSTVVAVWDIAKWPVIVVLVSLAFAVLYWAAPNVRHPGFRWLTPGSVLALLLWGAASAGFAVYVANFGSYNKTYGSLAGVVVFLVWLWISNIALLLGAEFDAELARGQRIEAGQPAEEEPFLPPRDTRSMDD